MNNPMQWFERAKDFYSKVFNLQFQFVEMPDSKMYMFGGPNKVGSAGSLIQSGDNKPSADGTIIYFSCEDVNIELGRIEEAGGQLVVPKTDIGEFGFFAQVMDTEGNRIGLHSLK